MAGAAEIPPAAAPQPLVLRLAKTTAAVVAFTGSVLGIVFVLWPSLKPEPPSPTHRVDLSELRLERGVTKAAYLRRIHQPAGGLEDAVLNERGALASFDFEIEGYKNRRLPVVSQLVEARGGDVIEENRDIGLTPEATEDRGNWPIWVPLPRGERRRVFIQMQLYEPRGVIALKTLTTHPFLIR
jgi:hypothetical protein